MRVTYGRVTYVLTAQRSTEAVSRYTARSWVEAAEYFARRKGLPLSTLLEIYQVLTGGEHAELKNGEEKSC